VAGRARGDESAVAWVVLADLQACPSTAGALTGLMNEPVIGGGRGVRAAVRSAWTGLRLPDDPGRAGLRRAARTALVIPATFAVARLVIGDAQVTLFVAFGCFALLVMADFGGPRRPRATAYVITTLVGATLVTLGTLVSPSAWVAALLMLLVGFGISGAAALLRARRVRPRATHGGRRSARRLAPRRGGIDASGRLPLAPF
jgi:energy-converting hydrogenase Eha subunit B